MKKIITSSLLFIISTHAQLIEPYRINQESIKKNQYNFSLEYLEQIFNKSNPDLTKILHTPNQTSEIDQIENRIARYKKDFQEAKNERTKNLLLLEFIIDINNISTEKLKFIINQVPYIEMKTNFESIKKLEREKIQAYKLLSEQNKK